VPVGDRDRIAAHAIPGAEPAREVGRPQVVRRGGRDGHHARVLVGAAPAAAAHEPAPREQIRRLTP
jgi:hypothetical protein